MGATDPLSLPGSGTPEASEFMLKVEFDPSRVACPRLELIELAAGVFAQFPEFDGFVHGQSRQRGLRFPRRAINCVFRWHKLDGLKVRCTGKSFRVQ
jgi:hypothetical protein